MALSALIRGATRPLCYVAVAAVCFGGPRAVVSQERAGGSSLSTAQIEEALRIAADENGAQKFLADYVLQTRTGLGTGPRVGWLSTPFSRVVSTAVAARRNGQNALTSADISDEILLPVILVIATSQTAAYTDNLLANVEEIAIGTLTGSKVIDILIPLKTRRPTAQDRTLYGLDSTASGVVALFDLDALAPEFDARSPNVVVRVRFDRVARGSNPQTACQECITPVSARIR